MALAAAGIAGVEIWRVGGAQAVAALAYGTESIRPVDKIVGLVPRGRCGQASGLWRGRDRSHRRPSEILVIADADNDPAWIAADLLSQAEHDEAAQAILITDEPALPMLWRRRWHQRDHSTAAAAGQSWQDNGAIITVGSMREMPALANGLPPNISNWPLPNRVGGWMRSVMPGRLLAATPEAIGDYVAGPNHVLPTARTSKFSSGLGVADFMKRTTTVECDSGSFARIAPAGVELANAEGLGAHALSMTIRMNSRG